MICTRWLAGVLLALCLGQAGAQDVTLTLHTHADVTSPTWKNVIAPWISRIEAESKGRIRIAASGRETSDTTPADALYDAVKEGRVDLIWTMPGLNPGRFQRIGVFELPFVMTEAEAVSRAMWEFTSIYAVDEFKDVKVLALHVRDASVLHTREQPVNAASDLRGLQLQVDGRHMSRLVTVLGGKPMPMSTVGQDDAIGAGDSDGLIAPWHVLRNQARDSGMRFHTEFDAKAGAFTTMPFLLAMNKNRYESLSAELKGVIDRNAGIDASGELGRAFTERARKNSREAIRAGDTTITLTSVDAEAFRKAGATVDQAWIKETEDKGFDGQKLLDGARTLVKKYTK